MTELSVSLWLTAVDWEKRINSMKAVRAAQAELIGSASIEDAAVAVRTVHETGEPYLIGAGEKEPVEAALVTLTKSGLCQGVIAAEPPEAHPSDSDSEESEFDYELSVMQTAMVLLAASGGSPSAANHLARLLSQTTGDADFFEDIAAAYAAVFPPVVNPLAALLGGE